MANEQTIANLIVKLSAQTVELASGLKKAEGMLFSFRDTAQKVLGGLSVAIVGQQFVSAISGAREFAAEMSRMSEKIGVPIEQLSALADAADKYGVSTEGLGTGLKFLSRNLFEASRGGGDLREIMKEMNVSFESSPGVIRPTMDVMQDLAERFKGMEDGAGKTAIAMKFFGRSGQEMLPFMNAGSEAFQKFMEDAQKFGTVIDSETGRKARLFGATIKEIGDAIKGLSIGIMSALLPSMQAGADSTLEMATWVNSLRSRLTDLGEALRYVGAVALPLVAVQIASAVVSFAGLGFAIQNLGFVIQYFSVTVLGPALMNPLTWLAVALAGLSVLWTALGKGTREAARAHEEFAASVRNMKIEDLKESLRDAELQMTLLIQKHQAMIEELERGPSFNLFADLMGGKDADETKKKIDELRSRIALLQKAIGDTGKQKVAAPVFTSEEVLKKFQDRIGQLKAEMLAFRDPAAGAYAALEEFIRQTVGATPVTDRLKKAIGELRATFHALYTAQVERASAAAIEKGQMAISVAGWESYGEDLKRQYDAGLIGIKEYYAQRRNIIVAQTRAEILALQQELAKRETPPERKAAIPAEITTKEIKRDASIAGDVGAEADAWRNLWASIREGNLADFVAQNDLQMSDLESRFADGLVATRTFFDERRRIIAENAKQEITGIEGTLPGLDPVAAQDAANKIRAIRNREIAETAKANRDEVLQLQSNLQEQLSLRTAFADLKARAAEGTLEILRAQQAAELAVLDERNAEELEKIRTSKDELILIEGEYLSKKEAMEQAQFLQNQERKNKERDFAREALLTELGFQLQATQALGEMFGSMYEAAGKKVKAFFYLQKAMAVAQVMIQTAIAVARLPADMPAFLGLPMAGILWANAAASVALIMAQTIKGMFRGGPVTGGSGAKDDVPAMLTRGEYVMTKQSADYYGPGVMEAIRRKIIPKSLLGGFGYFPVATPQFAFAGGGMVSGGGGASNTVTIPITINDVNPDKRLVSKLRSGVEDVVIKILREHTR